MPFRIPRPRRLLSTVALAVMLGTSLLPALSALAPAETDAATSVPRFGMATHLMWQTLSQTTADLNRMKAAGMSYVRFDVSWRNSEPSPGNYQYLGKLDAIVSAIQARGMRLTLTVIETPAWANGGRGPFAPPTNPATYARFVGMLAHRYAGRAGMVYEIWNEPNDIHFWTTGPNVAQYTAMLKAAYRAIHAAAPTATVLGGAILSNDVAFLRGIYANGGGGYFNGLSIHPYCGARAPGDTSSAWFSFKLSVPEFRREMQRHGQDKAIWITEFGWSTNQVSDSLRARYFAQAVAIAKTWTTVRGVAAYTLHQTQFPAYGLIRPDGSTTASWRAYDAAVP